jgi:D-xylose transport system substrate-binding protein
LRRIATILVLAVVLATTSAAEAASLVVGVSWNNFQEERWKIDEAAMRQVLDGAGAKYISTDAQSSPIKQNADIETLIEQGADVLIILAEDAHAVEPEVEKALTKGIQVIAYDRLIANPKVFYVTFDNVQVGVLEAKPVFALVPRGNYVFIKGNAPDPNSDFVRQGQQKVVGAALAAGAIRNVGETYTDNWDPANAQDEMANFLARNHNKVDAALVENDGMAGGVIAALAAQGLAGQVPVSGQDGDIAALNRVALGTQTVSVWKDARLLGSNAARIAVELGKGTGVGQIPGATIFTGGPKHLPIHALLLTPVAITRSNLDVVLDAGWVTRAEVCKGVPSGKVGACG